MATENGNDDWSNLRFRPRRVGSHAPPEDAAHSRFVYGAILFVAVALAYPWYSYWVQSHLLAADAKRAIKSFEADVQRVEQEAGAAVDETTAVDPSLLVRRSSPRILGISEGAATSVVVADLDGASLMQAERRLCSEAALWARRPVAGRSFRIQSYRGAQPAVSVGSIRC